MTTLRRPSFCLVASRVVFLVTLLAVPLAYRAFRSVPRPPQTPAELTEALQQFRPALYIVPANGRNPQSGIYISERPLPSARIAKLLRQPQHADRWKGVVYCERYRYGSEICPPYLDDWGDHGLHAGPLLFFGDPRLLEDLAPLVGVEGPRH
jgi:hypothetical protein